VIDLPPIQVEAVEHQRIQKRCTCDTVNTGVFPVEVKCAVSYGPWLHAIGAYLLNLHYLPVARSVVPGSVQRSRIDRVGVLAGTEKGLLMVWLTQFFMPPR